MSKYNKYKSLDLKKIKLLNTSKIKRKLSKIILRIKSGELTVIRLRNYKKFYAR